MKVRSQQHKTFFVVSGVALLLIMVCTLTSSFVAPREASAASNVDTVFRKIMLQSLQTCYSKNNGYMVRAVSELDYVQSGISALITSAGKQDGIVKLPNSIGNSLSDADISCQELFNGYSGWGGSVSGLFKLFGKSQSSTTLANLGYNSKVNGETTGDERGCVSFTYNYRAGDGTGDVQTGGKSNTLCFNIDANGKVNPDAGESFTDDFNHDNGPISMTYRDGYIYVYSSQYPYAEMTNITVSYGSRTWAEFEKEFRERIDSLKNFSWVDGMGNQINPGYNITKISTDTDGGDAYVEYGPSLVAATEALRYFTGNGDNTFYEERLNDGDKYILYSNYLNQALKAHKGTLYLDSTCYTSKDSALAAAGAPNTERYVVLSGDKWCPIRGVETVSEGFNILDSNGYRLKSGNFKDVVNGLMALSKEGIEESGTTVGTITDGEVSGVDGSGNTTTPGDTSTTAACYEGAGPLGWIACPVIGAVGEATGYLYNNFISEALEIRANTIMDRDDGVYVAWASFRDFANILFAIGFAVVILAQVTGLGLSNYNIKKILPRLIMVAILVNVSFILCQIVVDISNLLGVGIRDTFSRLPIPVAEGSESLRGHGGDIFLSFVSWLGIGAAGVTLISLPVALATAKYWIWPILVGLLGCLIGVLFFVIILAVRQAGIIVLVALAPVAIICYALPNTKMFFDRWKKLLTALLLVYPLCGLLMGGGEYAGGLLLSIGSKMDDTFKVFYTLTAALVTVVPFFFIPSLLKGSMALMGNLGAKISAFGSNLGRGVTRGARGTRFYQEHQAEEQRRLELKRNQTRVGRYSNDKGGGLVGAARRRLGMNRNLSGRAATRAALAQSGIDSTTSTTANAIRLRWESDGTASNIEAKLNEDGSIAEGDSSLESIYYNATRRLMERPTDNDALEQQKAASMLLAASKPGRESLRQANNRLAQYVNSLSGDEKKQLTAQQVMQRTANNILRTNAGDISKSPILDEQLTGMQAYKPNQYGGLETESLQKSIDKLSTRTMSSMGSKDLSAYIKAIQDGRIKTSDKEFQTLTSMASRTLMDPHQRGQIGADTMPLINQLANMRYTRRADGESDAEYRTRTIRNLTGADSSELARIQEGLQNSTISASDKQQILATLEDTMLQGVASGNPSSIGLTTDRAGQIHKILHDNGIDMVKNAQQGQYNSGTNSIGAMSSTQFAQQYESLMGLKIDHGSPRQSTITASTTNTPLGQAQVIETAQPDGTGRVDVYSPGGTRIGGGRTTPGGIIVDDSVQSRPRPTNQNGSSGSASS